MPRKPLIVLADDLTGAAEIGAIAHLAGLRVSIFTKPPARPGSADVLIFDSDTRLAEPEEAARRIRLLATRLRKIPHAGFFKKTDSVLRGPVLAELVACAEVFGATRTLLVPCNPSLGRTIRDGRYFIGSTPLDETAFARDPHHPRATADVCRLLGEFRDLTAASVPPRAELPRTGTLIGEADSYADVASWVGQLDRRTLAAGGADFFRFWLRARRAESPLVEQYYMPPGAALFLSGTTAAPKPITPFPVRTVGLDPRSLPSVGDLALRLSAQLAASGAAAATTDGPLVRSTAISTALTSTFGQVARELHATRSFSHLFVCGGATAAAVLSALGWSRLEVVRVWGPGAVTLRPITAPTHTVTLKPGSYAWPESLAKYFHHLHASPNP